MKTMKFQVTLRASGNPDHGQFIDSGVLAPTQIRSGGSIDECQKAVRAYIEEYNLGAGNWVGGEVRTGGRILGRISYNGRFWPSELEQKL